MVIAPSPLTFQCRAARRMLFIAIKDWCEQEGLPFPSGGTLRDLDVARKAAAFPEQIDVLDAYFWIARGYDQIIDRLEGADARRAEALEGPVVPR